jgi:hypothetical protein
MNTAVAYGTPTAGQVIGRRMLHWAVSLMFAVAFVVYVEPAPTDLMFAVVLLFFAQLRLTVIVGIVPLLILLMIYNLGGLTSFLLTPPQPKGLMFVVTSAYMSLSAVILALYVAADPIKNIDRIFKAWSIGAFFAAIWGLIDYFELPSPFPLQVLPGRATGLFKDPNVFSTFIIPPTIYLMQKIMLGNTRRPLTLVVLLLTIVVALFLAFSRGAWANFASATLLMVGLTFVLYSDNRMRQRVMLVTVAGLIVAAIAFMIMMSIPTIQKMFVDRFALVQYYDGGETGRFGNQLRSLPDLARLPFGYGPFTFGTVYGQAPHNTFINAFSAYGWLGGITYFMLIFSTLAISVLTIFARTPWQGLAIAVFCPLVATIFQGIQIDTDHWRHFYWMLGMMWGLFAITIQTGPQSSYVDEEFE